jgi:hypothetical protein
MALNAAYCYQEEMRQQTVDDLLKNKTKQNKKNITEGFGSWAPRSRSCGLACLEVYKGGGEFFWVQRYITKRFSAGSSPHTTYSALCLNSQ